MSVTVNDILGLNTLKSAQLICGKKGLKNEVSRVNFTDSPLNGVDPGYQLVAKGDLYIHSFYDDPNESVQQTMELLNFYINSGSACCIGVKYHSTLLPQQVVDMADKNNYPIIMIDNDVPFGKIIQEISELILTEQIDILCEDKLNRILFENISAREKNELLQFLLPSIPQKFICININYSQLNQLQFKTLKNNIWLNFKINFFRHNNGAFFILDKNIYTIPIESMDSLLNQFKYYGEDFCIGVSSLGNKGDDVVKYFKEAYYSCKIGQITNEKISYYDNASIYMMLLSLQNTDFLHSFSNKILSPLREYSTRHSVDMIETIKTFIATDGDYKESALRLNTHINTIRFRIQKAQNLLGFEKSLFTFIEHISMAFKIENLYENFDYMQK